MGKLRVTYELKEGTTMGMELIIARDLRKENVGGKSIE